MTSFRFKAVIEDFIHFWILATVALCLGILANQFRDKSLPLIYQTKEQRMDNVATQLAVVSLGTLNIRASSPVVESVLPETLSLEEFQAVVNQKRMMVLDARPEIFHRLGHVPGALALPQDDFETYYRKLQPQLQKDKVQALVVYCSNASCEDSGLVAKTLRKLGYTHVSIFPGGWSEWTQAGLPQEQSQETKK